MNQVDAGGGSGDLTAQRVIQTVLRPVCPTAPPRQPRRPATMIICIQFRSENDRRIWGKI